MTPTLPTFPLWVNLILVAVGILSHALSKLSELEQRGQPTDIKTYIMTTKWTTLSVVVSAYLLFLVQYYMGESGPIAAILTGVSCNSAGDKLRARGDAAK